MDKIMIHDDDCGEQLTAHGFCDKCGFYPDMQSTAFVKRSQTNNKANKKKLEISLPAVVKCMTPGCGEANVVRIGRIWLKVCQKCAGHWGISDRTKLEIESKQSSGEPLHCIKCNQPMPLAIDPVEILQLHHHCTVCNAWLWGSGIGFEGHNCVSCMVTYGV